VSNRKQISIENRPTNAHGNKINRQQKLYKMQQKTEQYKSQQDKIRNKKTSFI